MKAVLKFMLCYFKGNKGSLTPFACVTRLRNNFCPKFINISMFSFRNDLLKFVYYFPSKRRKIKVEDINNKIVKVQCMHIKYIFSHIFPRSSAHIWILWELNPWTTVSIYYFSRGFLYVIMYSHNLSAEGRFFEFVPLI